MVQMWIDEKQRALKTGDWDLYNFVLKESIKNLSILYAKGTKEWYLKIVGEMIKIASCELRGNIIKYKEREANNMKAKPIPELTDTELLDKYKAGSLWVTGHMQVTGTDKNELGTKYNHEMFMTGLKRLEVIENELMKRGITYG